MQDLNPGPMKFGPKSKAPFSSLLSFIIIQGSTAKYIYLKALVCSPPAWLG